MDAYTLRVGLHRDPAVSGSPAVRFIGAMTSAASSYDMPSPRYLAAELEVAIPDYSQEVHVGLWQVRRPSKRHSGTEAQAS